MAEIRTTRMRLVQWTEGTDSPQRVDFNETFLNIETLAAIDQQGTKDNRPTPNKTGMYYFATDEGILYRSDGLTWAVVGSSTLSHLIRAARTNSVSLTIQAIASQTSDLHQIVSAAGATLFRVRPNGDVLAGPLRVSQAARTTTASDTAPTDSAATLDNNSGSMWGFTAKNTTGNTAGFYRAVRGTSTVFSVGPDGSVSAPSVTLSSAPTNSTHATTKSYVDAAVADRTYALTSDQLTGQLPVSKGGTGGTTPSSARDGINAAFTGQKINTGAGLSGGGDLSADRTLSVVFPTSGGTRYGATVGGSDTAARYDHGHSLSGADIVGTLPVANGGTGATTLASGSYVIGNGTNEVTTKTPAQVLADIGGASSGHGHALTDANITGTLPVSQGGTGATTTSAARTALGVPVNTTAINTGNGLTGGGNLTASRTISVSFAGTGSANTVARSDHKHAFSEILERLTAEQMPVATELPGGVNLDTITTDGDYTQTSSAEAASGTNYPSGIAGKLRVVTSSSGNMVWQKYTVYATNNPTEFVRTRYNGTWGQWRQMADVNDIAALASVYAPLVHGHSLTDANVTGTLPLNQGGTGATTQAEARSALGVPSTSVSINAGAGLSGGGSLAASRTLQVVFEGSGSKTTSARSDHGHALTDANVTGILPVVQGGTGRSTLTDGSYLQGNGTGLPNLRTPAQVLSDIGAATSGHGHALTDSNITGILPVNQGGTGANNAGGARTNLNVPSRDQTITAGDGLTGGGSLDASRTLAVDFSSGTEYGADQGVGTKVARFDHQHVLSGSRIAGVLPIDKGGTGATSASAGLDNLGGLPREIEVLPSNQNIDNWKTTGKWVPAAYAQVTTANGYPAEAANSVVFLEHTQVSSNYAVQVLTMAYNNRMWRRALRNGTWYEWYLVPRTPYRVNAGSASGWIIYSNGISVVAHDDGTKGCSMEVTMSRTDPSFTQGSSYMVHGYFVPSELRPSHVGGQYFWCQIATAPGIGFIRWSDGQFSCRTDTTGVSQVINPGSRITFNLNWVV